MARLESATAFAPATTCRRSCLTARKYRRSRSGGGPGGTAGRVVRPLGVFFWGRTWTLAAWCELRNDFRNFRLDRATDSTMLPEPFDEEPGKSLKDLLTRYGPQAVKLLES